MFAVDPIPTAVFGAVLLAFVGLGEGLRLAGVRPEHTRRIVHAGVGLATAVCPPFFAHPGGIYALAALFVVVNVVAIRRRLFLGMHGIARASWGTVAFPVALLAGLWLCWTLDPSRIYALQTAFLVLAVSDPLASIVGQGVARPGPYRVNGQTKSVAGSAAFAASAAGLIAVGVAAWGPEAWGVRELAACAVTGAALATAAEALGTRGWDNLLLALAVMVALTLVHERPGETARTLAAAATAIAFGLMAWRVGFLDLSGTLAASMLAWAVVSVGGAAWAVPAFTFFFASSLLSRVGRRRKAAAEARAAKGSRRDAGQVLANGGVAAALLVATLFAGADALAALYWGFVGAFAAAAADTWATEIGTLVGGRTRDVLRWRPVAPGVSGGVSLGGTLGGALGAAVVFASAVPFAGAFLTAPGPLAAAALVVGGAVAASALDSLLGATLQARYRDADGALTERAVRDGAPLPLARGVPWVDNDRVNLACTLAGAAVPLVALLA